jgi:hypothetical protein
VKSVSEDEKGLIPLGESLPKLPKNVIVFHWEGFDVVCPSTWYMMARTMTLAPIVKLIIFLSILGMVM